MDIQKTNAMGFVFIIHGICFCVELEGVEPSSKQGTNLLSTCLSSLWFSCAGKTEATNRHLIF